MRINKVDLKLPVLSLAVIIFLLLLFVYLNDVHGV